MSTGHGSDLPDYSGGHVSGSAGEPYGTDDPYRRTYDPYAQAEPAHGDPYTVGPDDRGPHTTAPYATDPYESDGFGPVFGSSGEGSFGGYPGASPAHPVHAAQPYGGNPPGPYVGGYYPPALPSSGAAVTGFVLGLLALTMCAGLTAPVGIFFAARGMKDTSPVATDRKGGRGLAIAALVTNLIGLIPFVVMMLYIAAFVFLIITELAAA